jgi:rhodanese-related sulfurtransferase
MKRWRIFMGLTFLILLAFAMPAYGEEDAFRISTEQLKNIIDSPDLVLLDVRTGKDWKKSDRKIIGAVRVNPSDVSSWAGEYGKDNKIILYCA